MTTTSETTATETVPTRDEISIKYFDYNLNVIKQIFESDVLSNSKKQQIANIVDEMAELFNNHSLCIKNLDNKERLSNLFSCEKISQLSLISQLTQF